MEQEINVMASFIGNVIKAIYENVDWVSVAIVLLGGLICKYYLTSWKWSVPFKTFIVGFVLITMYVFMLHTAGVLQKEDYPKFFFGVVTAFAVYPLVVKPFIDKFSNKKGD